MHSSSPRCFAGSGPASTRGARRERLLAALWALAAAGTLPLAVRGACMEPVLSEGDRLGVRRRRLYWPGDVVAVAGPDGRLLVHRALGYWPGRRGLALLTQADAAARPDRASPRHAVVGAVVARGAQPLRVRPRDRARAAAHLVRHLLRRAVERARAA